jgi:hypothetical protein
MSMNISGPPWVVSIPEPELGDSVGLANVVYSGAAAQSFDVADVSYTITYPSNQIVITGSDGSVVTISLSGGKIVGVA